MTLVLSRLQARKDHRPLEHCDTEAWDTRVLQGTSGQGELHPLSFK